MSKRTLRNYAISLTLLALTVIAAGQLTGNASLRNKLTFALVVIGAILLALSRKPNRRQLSAIRRGTVSAVAGSAPFAFGLEPITASFAAGFAAFQAFVAMCMALITQHKAPIENTAPDEIKNKRIAVFSDGTANSSANAQKTNVWRLYQLLDLGPTRAGDRVQIASYFNGVGTSGWRPIAMLGIIFGYGLKRNVLELYKYICRNHVKGDSIYAFGFSRGAFTIRILAGLITDQGLTPYYDERDLEYRARRAYAEFWQEIIAEPPFLTRVARAIASMWNQAYCRLSHREPYNSAKNIETDIEFVGVWDTVAAYGGPISELTRGFDKFVAPLNMGDYILSPKVKQARHALALDDERDSFWPLVWDEVAEARNVEHGSTVKIRTGDGTPVKKADRKPTAGRIKQVWFAGMHADVGGGYPDHSLAYVSLVWMLDEIMALENPLRFIKGKAEDYRLEANAFGPIHNSRSGVGVYYRYQPRTAGPLMHYEDHPDVVAKTLSLRDPMVWESETPPKPRGLLINYVVHESVLVRLASGSDNYAPIVIPGNFVIEPYVLVDGIKQIRLDDRLKGRIVNGTDKRRTQQISNWNWVWARRISYFITFALTMLFIVPPYVAMIFPTPLPAMKSLVTQIFGESSRLEALREAIHGLTISAPEYVPFFAAPLVKAMSQAGPFYLVLAALIGIMLFISTRLDQQLADRSRRVWWAILGDGAFADSSPTMVSMSNWIQSLRRSERYQYNLWYYKWKLAPRLFGCLIILAPLAPFVYALYRLIMR